MTRAIEPAYLGLLMDDQLHARAERAYERMAAERHPPSLDAILRAGTKEQLIEVFGLHENDFADR